VQDQIGLFDERVTVTLGAQLQYDSDWGAGVQPTARVLWRTRPGQRLWAAWSRARRTPSLAERGIRIDFPPVPSDSGLPLALSVVGAADPLTEQVTDVEAGYRLGIGSVASIDLSGYNARYTNLFSSESGEPTVELLPYPRVHVTARLANGWEATARGLELAATWTPLPVWRVDASYTAFHLTPQLGATGGDGAVTRTHGGAPHWQWQLRSVTSLGPQATLAAAIFRVGPLQEVGVSAYTRADLNVDWRVAAPFSVMVFGQNLLQRSHREFGAPQSLTVFTEMPRRVGVRLRWTSR
jgi:iron complex outermembrane receptor protein